jgi:hypothetical protein
MKKENRILIYMVFFTTFIVLTYSSCKKNTDDLTPVLTTLPLTEITQTTAHSGGVVTFDGGSSIISRGVCWSKTAGPTVADDKSTDGEGNGGFSSIISGLNPRTKYYLRAYATNKSGTGYGTTITFVTQVGQVPILTTSSISNVTQTTATCGGEITSDGGLSVTLRGVCYDTSPNPTLSDNFRSSGTGTGAYITNISGLSNGTTYYIRAYASNSIGTTYGNELSFSTIVAPNVTTSVFFDVKGISAKAGGILTSDGGANTLTRGLCWSTSPDPTTANSYNTSFTDEMSGLTPNTVYYVRAYATNTAGTSYGEQVSFNSGYEIGTPLEGGIVFYNDGNSHGLVCASFDQSPGAFWGCDGTILGSFSNLTGGGIGNTNTIIAKCAATGTAARICYDFSYKNYDDWFLPSKDELKLLYLNLFAKKPGNFNGILYWSSSEYGDLHAWLQDFYTGKQYYSSKRLALSVRAVRVF